jgi:protein SCO1/2
MTRSIVNNSLLLLIISCACNTKHTISSIPFINKPDFTPEWINENDTAYKSIHQIPPFLFTDQDGNTITEKSVTGKIYVANFFFTRCGSICPKMMANMALVRDEFRNNDDIIFLSHSVTPDMDSVPVLKNYSIARNIGNSNKWHLLTGNEKEIYHLARKEYYAGDTIGYYQAGDEFLHTENFILLDRERRIRGVYNGTLELEMERLEDDIRTLLKEE